MTQNIFLPSLAFHIDLHAQMPTFWGMYNKLILLLITKSKFPNYSGVDWEVDRHGTGNVKVPTNLYASLLMYML